MLRCEQIWASNNVTGIQINLGYYALAECILKGTYPSDALLRWCGLWIDQSKPRKPYSRKRKYVAPDKKVNEKVVELYRNNPGIKNKEIARIVNRSSTFVSRILSANGVKRYRWDYKKGNTE